MDPKKSEKALEDNPESPPAVVTKTSYTGRGEVSIAPWRNYSGCPRVSTLIRIEEATGIKVVIPIRCKTWRCPYCAPINAEQLQKRILKGNPTHFITLTTRPQANETAKACHDRTRPLVSRLLTKIRKTWGPIEAAIVLELTKRGYPHWHLLCRTNFIAQCWLADEWEKLSGAHVVDIRTIKNPSIAAAYCCKYITKNAQRTAERKIGRVISFTRRFSIKEQSKSQHEGVKWVRTKQHPLTYLSQLPEGALIEYHEGLWLVTPLIPPANRQPDSHTFTALVDAAEYQKLWNELRVYEHSR